MTNNKNSLLRMLVFFICIAFVSNRMNAQKTFSETLDIHLNAIRNADFVSFEPTVSDSLIHISPAGEKNQSKAQFIKLHQDWFKRTNWEWQGKILKKHSNSSLGYALIDYSYIEKDTAGNISFKIRCYLTLIFKKSPNGWQLVYDQNTIIPN
jgi:ketosteroid isomerase-like protein